MTRQSKSLRVFITDDEAVIRMGLRAMVAGLGHRVVGTATNGVQAIEGVKRLQPDLLLLDIKMPVMDGLTAAEALQHEHPLPMIMLTAYSERTLIDRAVNASVIGYLVKPIYEGKLGPMIDIAISRFEEARYSAQTVYQLRNKIETRDIVDSAKRVLVSSGLSEREAYSRLQSMARNNRRTMRQVAEAVLTLRR